MIVGCTCRFSPSEPDDSESLSDDEEPSDDDDLRGFFVAGFVTFNLAAGFLAVTPTDDDGGCVRA